MLSALKHKKKETFDVTQKASGKPFPFSFGFDRDNSRTKLDVIVINSEDAVTAPNIGMATLEITLLFKESRKARLPFIQSGKISVKDAKGILAEKAIRGLMDQVRFSFKPHIELIQKLIGRDQAKNEDLIFSYEFQCYDAWEKKTTIFSASEPFLFRLKEVLATTTNYYFLANEETRLLPFIPKSQKKKNKAQDRIIIRTRRPSDRNIKPQLANSDPTPWLSDHMAFSNFDLHPTLLFGDLNLGNTKMLPKVDDQNGTLWPDYFQVDRYWIRPDFELLLPNPGTSYTSSPFQFSFKNIGISPDGSPALEGNLLVTVRQFMNKKWVEKLDKKYKIQLLKMLKAQYKIRLPYIDGEGKQNHIYINASEITMTRDRIKASFSVANDWVRLLYGSLSTPRLPDAIRPSFIISYYCDAMLAKKEHSSYLISGLQYGSFLELQPVNTSITAPIVPIFSKDLLSRTPVRRSSKPNPTFTNNLVLNASTANLLPLAPINWSTQSGNKKKKKEYIRQSIHLSQNLILSLECTTYGDYFAEHNIDSYSAIGCSEPMRIGQIKTPPYTKIDALDHARYSVYKSQVMPQMFVIVPKNYVISRKTEEPEKFAPELFLQGAIDIENIPESRCVVDIKLQPDLTYPERLQLEKSLRDHTAHDPQIAYVSEIIGEETFHWNLSNSIIESASAYTFEETIRATLETNIRNAQLCKTMLENGGINGTYTKKLAPDLEVAAQMSITLDNIGLPWFGEGIQVENVTNSIQLTNALESSVYVDHLIKMGAEEAVVPVGQNLAPNGKIILDGAYGDEDHIAIFSVQTDQQALSEKYSYIEDIFQQIICFDMFSSNEHGNLLEVHVGCQDKLPYAKFDFTDGIPQQESYLLIPINEIISSELFGYYVKYSTVDGSVYESNWIAHNFGLQGNIINITSNIIT